MNITRPTISITNMALPIFVHIKVPTYVKMTYQKNENAKQRKMFFEMLLIIFILDPHL
jgi:hypothetical protein